MKSRSLLAKNGETTSETTETAGSGRSVIHEAVSQEIFATGLAGVYCQLATTPHTTHSGEIS